jgi:serine/threonine-protein kinase
LIEAPARERRALAGQRNQAGDGNLSGERDEIKMSSRPAISVRFSDLSSRALEIFEDLTAIDVRSPRPPVAAPREPSAAVEVLSTRDFEWVGPAPSRRAAAADAGAPLADPLIGKVVADRYRIVEPLGRGGMGIVYKVEHVRIGKLLAMKLLTGELSQNPDVVRRFKREALAVSRLQSPSTVQVFDFGVSEGLTYLVMELVSGDDLGRVLRREGPLPFARVGKIVVQVCSSLAEAHRLGIVHRDIKPENIMLLAASGGADVAKVLDFGLAKLRDTHDEKAVCDITSQGTILGTPYYMAPEQIRGEETDARTDVYAVGALMYRVLTGHHPFTGPPMTVLTRHLYELPIAPAERTPELGIPAGLSRVVVRALQKRPQDRFQRIEDLQKAVADEIRAAGSSSVDSLFDTGHLRRLALTAEPSQARVTVALATRDEVDAYERKLRRTRYGAAGVAVALLAAVGAVGSLAVHREAGFSGVEVEPNDSAAEATPIPLGQAVRGQLGRRMDALHGDRDFYRFDLPAGRAGEAAHLKLRVGALPNIPMCTMLYREGFADAVGQYCVGRPGRDLLIPALALEPGRYFLAILQDVAPHGSDPPYVYENISDTYAVLAERTLPEPGVEIEPNDSVTAATMVGLGLPVSATIGWARDEDVFCLDEGVRGHIRWHLRTGPRDGGVLEATALGERGAGAPVRVHGEEEGRRSDADVVSPWTSAPLVADGHGRRCLRVRVARDPWAPERTPAGGSERYTVEAEGEP